LRKLAVLVALFVLTSAFPAVGADVSPPNGSLTYDDHLAAHGSIPAVEQAENFIAEQEASGFRAAPDAGRASAFSPVDGCPCSRSASPPSRWRWRAR